MECELVCSLMCVGPCLKIDMCVHSSPLLSCSFYLFLMLNFCAETQGGRVVVGHIRICSILATAQISFRLVRRKRHFVFTSNTLLRVSTTVYIFADVCVVIISFSRLFICIFRSQMRDTFQKDQIKQ